MVGGVSGPLERAPGDEFPECDLGGDRARVPAGHHEDFFEALANLHQSIEWAIRRKRGEKTPTPFAHPGVDEGVAGMRFVAAAVASSKKKGAWTKV